MGMNLGPTLLDADLIEEYQDLSLQESIFLKLCAGCLGDQNNDLHEISKEWAWDMAFELVDFINEKRKAAS